MTDPSAPGLPPPSGPRRSSPQSLDPWGEQRRRDEEHRSARRRRRLRRVLVSAVAVAVLAGAGAGVWWWSVGSDDPGSTEPAPPTTAVPTTVATTVPPTTVAPEALVSVGEVWLLDRGDGVYDWGLNITVPEGSPTRSGVEVVVTLLDPVGEVVEQASTVLDGVGTGEWSTFAGRTTDPDGVPVRLEYDLALGRESTDVGMSRQLDSRAIERDGDELSGRIRSVAAEDITDISMVLVWRAEEDDPELDQGEIATVVVYDVERIRPGVDARFEIDLADQRVPDGVPDDVLWSPAAALHG